LRLNNKGNIPLKKEKYMKARLPKGMGGGPQNMQAMLKQAQKMQEQIEAKKAELEEKEYVVSSGGGMVEVTVTGKHEVKAIGINPEVVDPEDVEMLEDMLVAALNEANRQIEEESEREMDAATGGLNIPGL
jgi:DNA-binding YbaB/EbfC family protein